MVGAAGFLQIETVNAAKSAKRKFVALHWRKIFGKIWWLNHNGIRKSKKRMSATIHCLESSGQLGVVNFVLRASALARDIRNRYPNQKILPTSSPAPEEKDVWLAVDPLRLEVSPATPVNGYIMPDSAITIRDASDGETIS